MCMQFVQALKLQFKSASHVPDTSDRIVPDKLIKPSLLMLPNREPSPDSPRDQANCARTFPYGLSIVRISNVAKPLL